MNKKDAIDNYKLLYTELNSIICDWDPYELSDKGRIQDEFSGEVTLVLCGLKYTEDSESVTKLVSSVFSKSFSPNDFGIKACNDVGIIIYKWWESKK